jgi:hypothetical protein
MLGNVLQIIALQQLSNQLAEALAAVHKAAGKQQSCWKSPSRQPTIL